MSASAENVPLAEERDKAYRQIITLIKLNLIIDFFKQINYKIAWRVTRSTSLRGH